MLVREKRLIAGVRGKVDPLLGLRILGITSRQGKQMLGLEEDEGSRLRFHVRLFRLHHQERYVRLLSARIAFCDHSCDLLEEKTCH